MVQISRLPLVLIAGAAALAMPGAAQAEDISLSVGGGLHVGADVHVNVDRAFEVLADVHLGWGVYVDFADPPPPFEPEFEGSVPSYGVAVVEPIYVEPVYIEPVYIEPVYVAPVHVHVDGGDSRPAPGLQSRWGIGAFAGTMSTKGMESGSDLGLVGQYRFSRAVALELELAKSTQAAGDRVDRRLGAALLYTIAPQRRLAPFLLAGAGYGQSEIAAGEFHAQQGYGEIGAGLRLRLSRSIQVVGDIRSGRRSMADDQVYMSKTAMSGPSVQDNEDYTRLRVGGLITF